MHEIKQRILQSWMHTKKSTKQFTDLTKAGKSQMMHKWLKFAKEKGSNNEELHQERSRIKVVQVKLEKLKIGQEEMMKSKMSKASEMQSDAITEGLDTVSEYDDTQFNQLRVKTFFNKDQPQDETAKMQQSPNASTSSLKQTGLQRKNSNAQRITFSAQA